MANTEEKYVEYQLIAPACESCSRPEEERGYVRFDLKHRKMLFLAGEEDWPNERKIDSLALAHRMHTLRAIFASDPIGFAEADESTGWFHYGQLMGDITRLIALCESVPKGTVKVRLV